MTVKHLYIPKILEYNFLGREAKIQIQIKNNNITKGEFIINHDTW